jgi:asparagine synthase (glutamine-hydrolysing)
MNGILPELIRNRQDKIGFESPQDEWFRNEKWQNILNEIFSSEKFKSRGIFNVERVKKMYAFHCEGVVNEASSLWKIVHLELWFRKFID